MKQLLDTTWQRRGVSWIWDEDARNQVCAAEEVWSLRQLLSLKSWPNDLPSNDNQTLVVAGLDGSLDLLSVEEVETWLGSAIKRAILSFQDAYSGEAALIFWLPGGHSRLKVNAATGSIEWRCAPPNNQSVVAFSRILWGDANEYPQEIHLPERGQKAGFFHLRIT